MKNVLTYSIVIMYILFFLIIGVKAEQQLNIDIEQTASDTNFARYYSGQKFKAVSTFINGFYIRKTTTADFTATIYLCNTPTGSVWADIQACLSGTKLINRETLTSQTVGSNQYFHFSHTYRLTAGQDYFFFIENAPTIKLNSAGGYSDGTNYSCEVDGSYPSTTGDLQFGVFHYINSILFEIPQAELTYKDFPSYQIVYNAGMLGNTATIYIGTSTTNFFASSSKGNLGLSNDYLVNIEKNYTLSNGTYYVLAELFNYASTSIASTSAIRFYIDDVSGISPVYNDTYLYSNLYDLTASSTNLNNIGWCKNVCQDLTEDETLICMYYKTSCYLFMPPPLADTLITSIFNDLKTNFPTDFIYSFYDQLNSASTTSTTTSLTLSLSNSTIPMTDIQLLNKNTMRSFFGTSTFDSFRSIEGMATYTFLIYNIYILALALI